MQIKTKDLLISGTPSEVRAFLGEEIASRLKNSTTSLLPNELLTLFHGLTSSKMILPDENQANPLLCLVFTLAKYIQSRMLQGQGLPNGLLNDTFYKISMD